MTAAPAPRWWKAPTAWLRRPHGPEDGWVTLDRRHIYIIPAAHGVRLAVLVAVMLLASLNYDLSMGFLLTFLLVGVGLAAMWQTYRNLIDLRVTARGGDAVFAGEPARFELTFDNPFPVDRIGLELDTAGSRQHEVDLGPQSRQAVPLRLPTKQRGWIMLPRLRIISRYPLGLFRAWSYADLPARVLAYPAPETNAPPLPEGDVPDIGDEQYGRQEEAMDALRDYRPGDPLRRIAWRHSARTDTLLTRTGESGAIQRVVLDWQQLTTLPEREDRLSRLTAWVLLADAAGCDYALRLPGRELPLGRGAVHRTACLEALALWEAV